MEIKIRRRSIQSHAYKAWSLDTIQPSTMSQKLSCFAILILLVGAATARPLRKPIPVWNMHFSWNISNKLDDTFTTPTGSASSNVFNIPSGDCTAAIICVAVTLLTSIEYSCLSHRVSFSCENRSVRTMFHGRPLPAKWSDLTYCLYRSW